MLLALVLRGVAFEFRFKAHDARTAFLGQGLHRRLDRGHLLPGRCPRRLHRGIPVAGGSYAGGALDWISPFSLFTGTGLLVTYALLGSTWLIMKTEGATCRRMARAPADMDAAGGDRRHQRVDTVGRYDDRGALVQPAEPALAFPGAAAGGGQCRAAAALVVQESACAAVPVDAGAGLPRLQRAGHQSLAEYRSADNLDLGSVVSAGEPEIRAGRRALHHSDHPGLYGLELLRVPRQGHATHGYH